MEAGPSEKGAQRIDVAPERNAPQQHGLDDRCSASHERVINDLSRIREPGNEEPRQLRLEASTVRNLLKTAGRSLFCRPELVDVSRDGEPFARRGLDRGFEDPGRLPEITKTNELPDERRLQVGCLLARSDKIKLQIPLERTRGGF